jgi:hypothetical protein
MTLRLLFRTSGFRTLKIFSNSASISPAPFPSASAIRALSSWSRTLIETVNDQLKNICGLEHTRHRSLSNCFVNVLAALVA